MFFNLSSAKKLHLHLPLGSCQFTSLDMSSTPRKITRKKLTSYINDTPNVELAIGSILVTIEHERSDTRLEYRDFIKFIGTSELLTIPSEFYLSQIHLQDL